MKLGFQFVPFPLEIWNNAIDLSKSEFRLLGWLLAGLRLGVDQGRYTDDHLLSGCDGRPAVGLSRNSMKEARTCLINRGFMKAQKLGGGVWCYTLELSEVDTKCQELTPSQVSEVDTPSVKVSQQECQSSTPEVSKVDTYIRNIESTEDSEGAEKNPPNENRPLKELAALLIQLIAMPDTPQNLKIVIAGINSEVGRGKSPPAAAQYITACALDAIQSGNHVDKFWFEDAKWRKLNGKQQPVSHAASRSERSIASITNALRKHVGNRATPNQGECKD